MIILLVIAVAWTKPGKHVLARGLERLADRYLEGELKVGRLSGNFFRHLAVHDVKFRNHSGRVVATIANVAVEYRFDLSDWMRPRAIVELLDIEQPRFAEIDFRRLVRSDEKEPTRTSKKETASTSQSPRFWLQRVRIVEGAYGKLAPIQADVRLPELFDRLPEGRVLVRGIWRGLSVAIAAELSPVRPPRQAPPAQRLSGIRKQGVSQSAAFVGKFGASMVEFSGEGRVDPRNWTSSDADLTLSRFKYAAVELGRLWPGLPKKNLEAKAYAKLHDEEMRVGLETHIERRGKLLVKALTKGLPMPKSIELERLELYGRCPLLKLKRPARLSLVPRDLLPVGQIELRGCGGAIHYERPSKAAKLRLEGVALGQYLDALGVAFPRDQKLGGIGKLDATIELAKGLRAPDARVKAELTQALGVDRALLAGSLRDGRLRAQMGIWIDGHALNADMKLAGVTRGNSWSVDLTKARGQIEATTNDFDLVALRSVGLLPEGITGALTARLQASNTAGKALVHLDAKADNVITGLSRSKLSLETTLDYDSAQATLSAKAMSAQAKDHPLELDATIAVPQRTLVEKRFASLLESPARWSLRASKLDLAKLFTSFDGQGGDRPPLWLSIDAAGEGALGDPRARLGLHVETTKGRLLELSGKLAERRVSALLSARDATVDPVLSLVSDQVRTQNGKLNADFHIDGQVTAPEYSGTIQFDAEKFMLPALASDYEALHLKVRGDTRRVVLDQLRIKGGGTLEASGQLELTPEKAAKALRLEAKLDKFYALTSEKMRVETSGKLELTANRSDSSFGGSVELTEGRIELPDNGKQRHVESLGALEDVRVISREQKKQSNGLFSNIHGEIKIDVPERFWVSSRDKSINVELDAHLSAGIDNDGDTFLTGSVRSRQGVAEFFGRRFEVSRASVNFEGDPSEPRINGEAIYNSSPWNIQVSLQGRPKDLKPKLESDPSGLSEDQCLGVLLTGSPDYRNRGGGGSPSASSVATGLATGFLVGQLKEKLGPELPFDTLTADLSTDRSGNATQATTQTASSSRLSDEGRSQVEVGKYLTDRIFVKLGRVFSSEDQAAVDKLMLDYRLSNRWSIETTQTDQGRSAVEVLWTLNY